MYSHSAKTKIVKVFNSQEIEFMNDIEKYRKSIAKELIQFWPSKSNSLQGIAIKNSSIVYVPSHFTGFHKQVCFKLVSSTTMQGKYPFQPFLAYFLYVFSQKIREIMIPIIRNSKENAFLEFFRGICQVLDQSDHFHSTY